MKIRIQLFLAIIFLISFNACKKEKIEEAQLETVCDVENPLEDLVWLSDLKFAFEVEMGPNAQRIIHFTYNGNDVFLIQNCYNCNDALDYLVNCEGGTICEFGGITGFNTCPDFESTAVLVEILFEG